MARIDMDICDWGAGRMGWGARMGYNCKETLYTFEYCVINIDYP